MVVVFERIYLEFVHRFLRNFSAFWYLRLFSFCDEIFLKSSCQLLEFNATMILHSKRKGARTEQRKSFANLPSFFLHRIPSIPKRCLLFKQNPHESQEAI